MVLLTILALMLILLTTLTVFTISVVGSVGIVVFGDVIVCLVFIVLIIRYLIRRKRKNKT